MRVAPLAVGLLLAGALAVPAAAHLNHVTATPQATPDGVVRVETVSVVEEAFLVVHDGDGRPVGHTAVEPGRTRHDVAVAVAPRAWANASAPALTVGLYLDDGDGEFDPDADTRLSRRGLLTPATVPVARGPRAYVSAGGERPQPTAGTVEIRRAVLPAAGHLVLQRTPGDADTAVGHATLAPGEHTDVRVDLNRSALAADAPVRLWATLYRDDGDGAFDAGDSPVTAGNETVQSALRVDLAERTVDLAPTTGGVPVVTATAERARWEVSPLAVAALLCSLLLGAYFLRQ